MTGCHQVSPGCAHCYAKTFAERWRGIPGHPYEQGFDLRLWPDRLEQPLHWTRSRMIFVNSMSDLFHEGISDEYIAQVFDVMRRASQHTFQVLTKRHERLAALAPELPWPENIWMGVSIEDAERFTLLSTAYLPKAHLKMRTLAPAERADRLEALTPRKRKVTYPAGTRLRFR